ncbi:MAG: hypothetical protein H6585_13595 [Flavobacteriales bacterium]|nr:hypothetical protein [Flavobacteriales bacterium]MCB9449362.1 hypothetical protein [Flavobacteriales bacterium]
MNEKKKKRNNPLKTLVRTILMVITGKVLSEKGNEKMVPYILFLTFLGILYIANIHFAERTVREMNHVNQELKELQSEYITTRSELMYRSKQSHVAEVLEPLGIKESRIPPKKIVTGKK